MRSPASNEWEVSQAVRGGRSPTFFKLVRSYPDQELTVLIWDEDRDRFDAPRQQAFAGTAACTRPAADLGRARTSAESRRL